MKDTTLIPSNPNYERNSQHDKEPCFICGKPVKKEKFWIEVVDGGIYAQRVGVEADVNDAGYMGSFPVGPSCAKLPELEGFVHKA